MNSAYFLRLAFSNIKNNRKIFTPYILTCTLSIAMFYIIHAIGVDASVLTMVGGESIRKVLFLGTIVLGIFSTIFLFYTNSFLIKKRRKEIGLLNVLGLGKNHVRRMIFDETLIILCVSFLSGIVAGVVLFKVLLLLFLKLLAIPAPLGFSVSLSSISTTFFLFGTIFLATFVYNAFHVTIKNPIELVREANSGEKEPKTNWVYALVGIVALAGGYGIALSVNNALDAVNYFLPAVVLVMLGTYGIFSALSVAILKMLRKRKNFYYQPVNFITVSNLIYRMRQNAVGLANICILSTAVIIMLSTTASLYVGIEDVMHNRYPMNIMIAGRSVSAEDQKILESKINETINQSAIKTVDQQSFVSMSFLSHKEGDSYMIQPTNTFDFNNGLLITVIEEEVFNTYQGTAIDLGEDEIVLLTANPSRYASEISINNHLLSIVDVENELFGSVVEMDLCETCVIVVDDFRGFFSGLTGESINPNTELVAISSEHVNVRYEYNMNVDGSEEDILQLANTLRGAIHPLPIASSVSIDDSASSRNIIYSMYGGLLFLGIFIGTIFLVATVLIIYYKQISEGMDDRQRFDIMQKVGMDRHETKKIIRNQVLLVFFLPLGTAVVHTIVAFPILMKILRIFNLVNVNLYMITTAVTIGIFALIYGVVYHLTAKLYYDIVN